MSDGDERGKIVVRSIELTVARWFEDSRYDGGQDKFTCRRWTKCVKQ